MKVCTKPKNTLFVLKCYHFSFFVYPGPNLGFFQSGRMKFQPGDEKLVTIQWPRELDFTEDVSYDFTE